MSNTSNESLFKFEDVVTIKSGFYRGRRGPVQQCEEEEPQTRYRYMIKVGGGPWKASSFVWENEDNLQAYVPPVPPPEPDILTK